MRPPKKKPTAAKLLNWRVSIMRARAQGLGTVAASDRQFGRLAEAEAEAVKAFGLRDDQRRRLLILELELRAMKRRTKKPDARARTFEEVRVANLADPFHAARVARV
jgi:hypothetical protein